jgi:hypothetical protein
MKKKFAAEKIGPRFFDVQALSSLHLPEFRQMPQLAGNLLTSSRHRGG